MIPFFPFLTTYFPFILYFIEKRYIIKIFNVSSHEFLNFIYIKAEYFARGKVLLSSEYLVVQGATALALPTKMGQRMKIQELSGSEVLWNSFDHQGKKWFEAEIDLMGLDVVESSDPDTAKFIKKLFRACCNNNSEFLSHWKKYKIDHYLEFPISWGLGSSSTLIYNMALWADVNPYHLYFDIEDGSGYDIACAGAKGPILYTLGDGSIDLEQVEFKPSFQDQIYFLPLNQKTDSREAVKIAKKKVPEKSLINKISDLAEKVLELKTLNAFEDWIVEHENIISSYISEKKVKDTRFADYWGAVKSLGAWGGDLVLVTSNQPKSDTEEYFKSKGFGVLIPYKELIL